MQVYFGGLPDNLWFSWRYLIKYAHNNLISDVNIFGDHNVINFLS